MVENYMNLNNVWTPVLIAPAGTTVTDDTIINDDIRYSVTLLKADDKSMTYIINNKECLILPDDAKQQIMDLQTANNALGQQVSSLTLANATLGQQVAELTLQIAAQKGGETA